MWDLQFHVSQEESLVKPAQYAPIHCSSCSFLLPPSLNPFFFFLFLFCHTLPTGVGNGNPLQYSCLENPVDRGAWWAAVHGVAKNRTWLKQLSMPACIGEGNGNPPQDPCLENCRDGGAWWAAVYGVAQSQTRLKRLSSSSSSFSLKHLLCAIYYWPVIIRPLCLPTMPSVSWRGVLANKLNLPLRCFVFSKILWDNSFQGLNWKILRRISWERCWEAYMFWQNTSGGVRKTASLYDNVITME